MAELPIQTHKLESTPEQSARDSYTWRVWLDGQRAALGPPQRLRSHRDGSSAHQLHERLPQALQRYAQGRLRNDLPVLDQVLGWNVPITLHAEHFR